MVKEGQSAYAAAKAKLVAAGDAYHVALAEFIALSKGESADKFVARVKTDQTSWPGIPSFTAITPSGPVANGKKRSPAVVDSDDDEVDDLGTSAKKPRAKKVKKEKDPNAPKRPPSAFIMFQNSVRSEIKAENPEMDHKGLAKLIGERWQAMPEADKNPWTKAGKDAMSQWSEEKKAYDAANPELAAAAKVATRVSPETVAAAPKAAAVPGAEGEKPKKKRGRPSNAELAAREAAKQAEAAKVLDAAKKKEEKKKKVAKPAVPSPTKKSVPAPADSSDDSSEDSSDDSDSDAPAPAAPPKKAFQIPKKAAPAPVESSSEESSEVSSDSDEDEPAPPPPPRPSPSKSSKHKSAEKKIRK